MDSILFSIENENGIVSDMENIYRTDSFGEFISIENIILFKLRENSEFGVCQCAQL
jgi:hypothetical protein